MDTKLTDALRAATAAAKDEGLELAASRDEIAIAIMLPHVQEALDALIKLRDRLAHATET